MTSAAPDSVGQAAGAACRGRSWLGFEPVYVVTDEDGHLIGSSKRNFMPHTDDVADAAKSGLPDGTIRDALDVLCQP